MRDKFKLSLFIFCCLYAFTVSAQHLSVLDKSKPYGNLADKKMGLKDGNGKTIVKPIYQSMIDLTRYGYYVAFSAKSSTFIFLDAKTGAKASPHEYYNQGDMSSLYNFPFAQGLQPMCRMVDGDFRWGYLDTTLKEVTPFSYLQARPFEKSAKLTYLKCADNKKWGLINGRGELVIPCKYDNVHVPIFHGDSTSADFQAYSVSENGKNYYINIDGEVNWNATAADLFHKGKYEEALFLFFSIPAEELSGAALNLIATAYEKGWGVAINMEEALFWHRRAVEKNIGTSFGFVGHAFFKGIGIAPNIDSAMLYYHRAAQIEPYLYAYWVGNIYYYGTGLEKNYAKAHEYYQMAAAIQEIDAMRKLSKMYSTGLGVTASEETAQQWLKKAKAAAAKSTSYKWEDNPETDIKSIINLKAGQVVMYQGKKGVIINNSSMGILLHDNRFIPVSTNINAITLLNENAADYQIKCYMCQGKGSYMETVHAGSSTYTSRTLHTGSTVTGDYIKTTTKIQQHYVERNVRCNTCNGTGKCYKTK